MARAAAALAPLLRDYQVIITYGNGPQVVLLAIENAGDPALRRPYPFDVLDAQTQGMIGYWLVQALESASPGRRAACLICRTMVKADDPAFGQPTKFVGPVCPEAQARRLAAEHGWQIRPDGTAWRRVRGGLPGAGRPGRAGIIEALADRGVIVVCAGGGGIPVVTDGSGLRGVEAWWTRT